MITLDLNDKLLIEDFVTSGSYNTLKRRDKRRLSILKTKLKANNFLLQVVQKTIHNFDFKTFERTLTQHERDVKAAEMMVGEITIQEIIFDEQMKLFNQNGINKDHNYNNFELHSDNRAIQQSNVNKLTYAFSHGKTIINPIIVYRNKIRKVWIIIDGQHRYLALKSCGLPIYFFDFTQFFDNHPEISIKEVVNKLNTAVKGYSDRIAEEQQKEHNILKRYLIQKGDTLTYINHFGRYQKIDKVREYVLDSEEVSLSKLIGGNFVFSVIKSDWIKKMKSTGYMADDTEIPLNDKVQIDLLMTWVHATLKGLNGFSPTESIKQTTSITQSQTTIIWRRILINANTANSLYSSTCFLDWEKYLQKKYNKLTIFNSNEVYKQWMSTDEQNKQLLKIDIEFLDFFKTLK